MVRITRPLQLARKPADQGLADPFLRAFAIPLDWAADTIERMSAIPVESPRIERRHVPRQSLRMRAFLEPVDRFGAVRSPLIYTRDADPRGLGFIARRDVAVLGSAEVSLPMTVGRPLQARCTVRRCREIAPRWYEGWLEFAVSQSRLAAH